MMLFDIMEEAKATLCWMPNFAFEHMARNARKAKHTRDLSHVRGIISCSEVVKPRSLDAFESAFSDIGLGGTRLSACYAMAETVFAVSQVPLTTKVARKTLSREALQANQLRSPQQGEDAVTLASSGRVVDGLDVSIVTEDGQDVGEIVIRGDFLFDGYYNRPDVTEKKLRDGAYYTGDLGFIDNGNLYVIGRNDDLIIVHGKNILAHEVEATLADVDGVKPGRVVCFATENPDTSAPEIAIAAETREIIDDPAALLAIRENIVASVFSTTAVVPFEVYVVAPNSLIKTTSGKMSRHANAARFTKSSD